MVADNWSIDFKQLRTDFDKPQHGVDEAAPGIPFRFWDDDPSCSSTSARYPSTQQVAGSSTDVDGPHAEVAPSAPAPSQLSDLPAEQRADVQPSTAVEALSNVTTVQLECLSERITIVEQLCEQLGESADKMHDFDEHVRYVWRARLDAVAIHLKAMLGTGCGLSEERSTSKERTRASRAVHCSAEC